MSRILIADDNVDWLASLKEVFSQEGYEVDAVSNGVEALAAAERNPPDILFTDLLMPEMDGFTLCQRIKAKPELADVPVVFCSGYFHERDQKRLEEALGVAHFVRKPAELDKILNLVNSIIGGERPAAAPKQPNLENQGALQEIYNTTMLSKLTGMVDMLHEERQTYKDLLLRFNSLTDSASDAIIIADNRGAICYWNKTAEDFFQYGREEAMRQPLSMIVPGDRQGADGGLEFLKPEEAKSMGDYFELNVCRKDGSQFPAEISHSSWQEKEGEPFHSLILRDVTARKALEEQLRRNLEAFLRAVAKFVEARDPYTAGHQRRVGGLADAIAKHLNLDEKVCEGVHFGALIHDIGKISVPAEILSKPSRLSQAEYSLIKTHPSTGFEILDDIDFPWPVAEMVHQHHERLDGSGYPRGLSGDDIMLEAKIIAVADVVEAITSHRPYRPALGLEQAMEEIKVNRGKFYDPVVVDACIDVLSDFSFD